MSDIYIFGNSPKCNTTAILEGNSHIVVLGLGINHITNRKINYWVTRPAKYNAESQKKTDKTIIISKEKNVDVCEYISNKSNYETLELCKQYNIKLKTYPTLGLFSILYFKQFYSRVYVTGISTNIYDRSSNSGYFWDIGKKLCDVHEDVLSETIVMSRMVKNKEIYEF